MWNTKFYWTKKMCFFKSKGCQHPKGQKKLTNLNLINSVIEVHVSNFRMTVWIYYLSERSPKRTLEQDNSLPMKIQGKSFWSFTRCNSSYVYMYLVNKTDSDSEDQTFWNDILLIDESKFIKKVIRHIFKHTSDVKDHKYLRYVLVDQWIQWIF